MARSKPAARKKQTIGEQRPGAAAPEAPRKARVPAARDETMRGMKRALAFLYHVALHPSRAIEVTKAMRLPWATAYRTLMQLEQAQLIRRDPVSNRYEIGAGMWFTGTAYVANHPVLRAGLHYLYSVEGTAGVVVQLSERFGYQAMNIFSAQPLAEEITKANYGFHFPLHCGSKGLVLLAYSEPEFVERYLNRQLERLTEDTITDPNAIRAELSAIQARGWSLTIADVQPFTGSIAAPVRDADGRVVASLCFVGRKTLMADDARRSVLLEVLLRTAHAISMNLGWRPGQSGMEASGMPGAVSASRGRPKARA